MSSASADRHDKSRGIEILTNRACAYIKHRNPNESGARAKSCHGDFVKKFPHRNDSAQIRSRMTPSTLKSSQIDISLPLKKSSTRLGSFLVIPKLTKLSP